MVNSSWKSKLLYLPLIEAFKVPNESSYSITLTSDNLKWVFSLLFTNLATLVDAKVVFVISNNEINSSLFFVASYFSLGSTGLSLKPENSFENSLDSTLFFKSVIVYLTSTLLLFFVIDFKLKL